VWVPASSDGLTLEEMASRYMLVLRHLSCYIGFAVLKSHSESRQWERSEGT
jgi:hypothetical protein